MIEMLQKFTKVTGAKTIPSLADHAILPDKVCAAIRHTNRKHICATCC